MLTEVKRQIIMRLLSIALENLEEITISSSERDKYLLNRTKEIIAEVIEVLGGITA